MDNNIKSVSQVYVPFYKDIRYADMKYIKRFYFNTLLSSRCEYYVCRCQNSLRIVFDDILFVFTDNYFSPKTLFIFRKVKDSAINYLKYNDPIGSIDYPTNFMNYDFDTSNKIMATDINHAYWNISFNKGIIEERLYRQGLNYKTTSLASLAVLSRNAKYQMFIGDKNVNREVIIGNERMKNLYKEIRNTCFSVMNEVREELASDFYKWRTDEISYLYSDKNKDLVNTVIGNHNLSCKNKIIN